MTKQSEVGHWWDIDTPGSVYYDADDPLTVTLVRFGLVNNAVHLYEGCGQERVNWVARTTAQRIEKQPSAASTLELAAVFGPFPVTLKRNNTLFRLVFRLGGSIDTAAENATFRVALASGRSAPGSPSRIVDYVDLATTSTTDAWLTGSRTYLENNFEAPYMVAVPSNRSVLDSATVDSLHAFYRIDVFVSCTHVLGGPTVPTARLSGFELREFIGD